MANLLCGLYDVNNTNRQKSRRLLAELVSKRSKISKRGNKRSIYRDSYYALLHFYKSN